MAGFRLLHPVALPVGRSTLPPCSTPSLFASSEPVVLALPEAEVRHHAHAFEPPEADRLERRLRAEIPWTQHRVRIAGREIPCPRLSAWLGEPHACYGYSGQRLTPAPWTPALLEVRARVAELTGVEFDGVLANLYRDGDDAMGWHSDDERELGPRPVIASVSFGATRRFLLRHRTRKALRTCELALAHGSLLVMAGTTQARWKHRVPRTARPVGPRINLTFRRLRVEG